MKLGPIFVGYPLMLLTLVIGLGMGASMLVGAFDDRSSHHCEYLKSEPNETAGIGVCFDGWPVFAYRFLGLYLIVASIWMVKEAYKNNVDKLYYQS